MSVRVRACANIALTKYWGKQVPPGDSRDFRGSRDFRDAPRPPANGPATPSIGLVLQELWTETTLESAESAPCGQDHLELNGRPADPASQARVARYIDLWRRLGLVEGSFLIRSTNHFPTAAGLASSASGFAALATALATVSRRRLSRAALSRLARQGSGSAARSIPGGLTLLPAGKDPAARSLLAPQDVPWGMVVAVVRTHAPSGYVAAGDAAAGGGLDRDGDARQMAALAKEVGSREGMEHTRGTSPYYTAWTRQARSDTRALRGAIERRDLASLGAIAEANALAMHACMLAARPALLYWQPATIAMLREVRRWRADGLEAYMTTDAGPHPVLLAAREDLAAVAERARRVAGVGDVLICHPGPGATVLDGEGGP